METPLLILIWLVVAVVSIWILAYVIVGLLVLLGIAKSKKAVREIQREREVLKPSHTHSPLRRR